MYKSYIDFINYIKGKKIMFCGLGKSNLPFINMLTKEKINVIAYDSKPKEKLDKQVLKNLEANEFVTLKAGDESAWNNKTDIIIRTPGMSFFSEKLKNAKKSGTIVTSEMEIFFELCPCKIIGITGSDGKTTVSTLISEMLKSEGYNVYLGGNIGEPLLPKINQISKNDIAVVELSSFQLMSMRTSPDIAIVTNISPNHLDIHSDMNEYIEAKKQILYHQNAFSKTILNFDNPETLKMSNYVRGECIFFSSTQKLENKTGVWLDEQNNIIYSKTTNSQTSNEKIMNTSEIKIPGKHNIENYLTAIAAVKELVKIENIKKVANSFNGVKHRIEFVKKSNGVSFYNDSIASSPNRTISGTLSLFNKKIILIAGGYDKKIPFDTLAKKIIEKVSVLILMGNTAEKIKNKITNLTDYDEKKLPIIKVNSMQEAVNEAVKNSKPNDIVVLSPACASFDLYKNFEERGDHFKSLIQSLD